MKPDDNVCLCFGVSLRKIQTYLSREDPKVASLISECLGAGTGCGWCVPYLKHLHKQHQVIKGDSQSSIPSNQSKPVIPTIEGSAEDYQAGRLRYRDTGERES
jgi:bacterioferritin-associated ferredoxin